jgi:hypothetical protein
MGTKSGTAAWYGEEAERLRALASRSWHDLNIAADLIEKAQQCDLLARRLMDEEIAGR